MQLESLSTREPGFHGGVMQRKFGLMAGWGEYPFIVAEALRRQDYQVVGLGVKDHVSPEFASLCDTYRELGIGRLGAAIRFFRRHNVKAATMVGKFHKVVLFRRFAWIRHFPDWECIRTFYPHWVSKSKDRRDDTLLGAVVDAYARHEIRFAPATDYVPELLVKPGNLAGRQLTRGQQKDVEFGWNLAKEMGRLDVGQTVVVKGQAVLAVEAVEGTDQCIRRAAQLCPQGGFTVVKVAKPQQDMRFDVPTIGLGTLETLRAAGGKVLAVEADKTIVIDQPAVMDYARRHRICLVALEGQQLNSVLEAA